MKCIVLLAILAAVVSATLPPLNIKADKIAISGISAGGAFAVQFHTSYSTRVYGSGVIAGPPYYCAQGEIGYALTYCMSDPMFLNLASMTGAATEAQSLGYIDSLYNMNSTRAYLFSGTKDTVVVQGVMDFTYEFYKNYLPITSIVYDNTVGAEHSWITNNALNDCSYLGSPFINNCHLDGAEKILKQILPMSVAPKGTMNTSNVYKFDQTPFLPPGTLSPASLSLANTGYAYIPTQCVKNSGSNVSCGIHIAFHGCEQNFEYVGESFVLYNGLNEFAETNNFIVVYPQTANSQMIPLNPKGCFDWWGYTNMLYHTKQGPQMQFAYNIAAVLAGWN